MAPAVPTACDSYSYDAYGVMLGGNPTATSPAATNYLYTGEQFDEHAQHYYLRARYYNPLNGRFNRMDPYAGSPQDPQSLHKYLYCHNNPVSNIDPTGRSIAGMAMAVGAFLWAQKMFVGLLIAAGIVAYYTLHNRSGPVDAVEVYFEAGSNDFRRGISPRLGDIEEQFRAIVPTTIYENANLDNVQHGYDPDTRTYRILVSWTRTGTYVGYTPNSIINISVTSYEQSYLADVDSRLTDENKSFLAGNVFTHEMVHAIYNHDSALTRRIWDHEGSGLMVDTTLGGSYLEQNPNAITRLLPFSETTRSRLRHALKR